MKVKDLIEKTTEFATANAVARATVYFARGEGGRFDFGACAKGARLQVGYRPVGSKLVYRSLAAAVARAQRPESQIETVAVMEIKGGSL